MEQLTWLKSYLRNFCLSLTVMVVLSSSLAANQKRYLEAGKTINIPSLGLKVKMPKNAIPQPAKSLTSYKIKSQRNGKSTPLEVFLLDELWLESQLSCSYGNEDFTVSVYEIRLPSPESVPVLVRQADRTYVLKESYDKWLALQQPFCWDEVKISDWVAYLLCNGDKAGKSLKRVSSSSETVLYAAEASKVDLFELVYVVSPSKSSGRYYAVSFKLPLAFNDKKSRRTVERCVESIAFFKPVKADDEDKKLSLSKKGVVNKDWSPEYIASRERVINNIRNLKGWWYLESDNFIIAANIKERKTIKELQEGLEKSRNFFMLVYPVKTPLKAVSVVKAFDSRNEYIAYVGKDLEWSGGVWMAAKKELAVSPISWGSVRERREAIVDVVHHEGFHQYIYFATGEQHPAVWFDEGNATFFEGIESKGKRIEVEPTRRVEQVVQLADKADISKLLSMSHEEFYGVDKAQNYALAYGLMFFLHKGAPGMTGKYQNNFNEIPGKYYQAILKTRNPEQSTTIAWDGVDMKFFVQVFRKFWSSRSLIQKASRYDIVPSSK
ncbi:MAG: DUF1570 domain-containing protein [Victivallaceae bacterium]